MRSLTQKIWVCTPCRLEMLFWRSRGWQRIHPNFFGHLEWFGLEDFLWQWPLGPRSKMPTCSSLMQVRALVNFAHASDLQSKHGSSFFNLINFDEWNLMKYIYFYWYLSIFKHGSSDSPWCKLLPLQFLGLEFGPLSTLGRVSGEGRFRLCFTEAFQFMFSSMNCGRVL